MKNLTCIECPKSCLLSVDVENCRVVKVSGNQCPRGEKYAAAEIENPVRILTSAVLTEGLALKMLPVRTNLPMPKVRIQEAMDEIKKIKLCKPVRIGEVIVADFLGLNLDLIVTRECL